MQLTTNMISAEGKGFRRISMHIQLNAMLFMPEIKEYNDMDNHLMESLGEFKDFIVYSTESNFINGKQGKQ